MSTVIAANVAGRFYPAEPGALRKAVADFIRDGCAHALAGARLRGGIVPHAGYFYSGFVAGAGFAAVSRNADWIGNVILLGPAHRYPLRGTAVAAAAVFETPLGPVSVSPEKRARAAKLPFVSVSDAPFAGEHCLEVELPFLQIALREFEVLPVLVGPTDAGDIAGLLAEVVDEKSLILVSSDLSHYLDDESARAKDGSTTRAIEDLAYQELDTDSACGFYALRGFVKYAKEHGLASLTLRVENSSRASGETDRVVGYGAYAFTESLA